MKEIKKGNIILDKDNIKEIRDIFSRRHNNSTFEKTFGSYLKQFRKPVKENN